MEKSNKHTLGKRVKYLDALRGFAMFLVVYVHVVNLSIKIPANSSVVCDFIALFHMPLFFFISGIFAYKALDKWDCRKLRNGFWRKVTQLLIPTLLMMVIYQLVKYGNATGIIYGPGRYWFTYCLFIFFTVYYLIIALCKMIKKACIEEILLLIGMLSYAVIYFYHPRSIAANWVQWESFACFFQFFAFGILCRKYSDAFQRIVSSDLVRTALIVVGVLLYICHRWQLFGEGFAEKVNSGFVLRYVFVLTTFILFVRCRTFFDGENVLSKVLRLVGRHTLDIYFLHYFFLIGSLEFFKPLLENNARPVVEIVICSITAVIIMSVTLLLSKWLRSSNLLGYFLLATKNKQTEEVKWW